MKALPPKFFGPSGVPCVFATSAGTTVVGYFTKQISAFRFIATDGAGHTAVVTLAQLQSQVDDVTNLPPSTCTILVQTLNGPTENISRISEYQCTTIQANVHAWHNNDPNAQLAGIVTPSVDSGDFFRLLEDGSEWLLETGSNWLTEQAGPYLLLENGGFLLLEDDGFFDLEGAAED